MGDKLLSPEALLVRMDSMPFVSPELHVWINLFTSCSMISKSLNVYAIQ